MVHVDSSSLKPWKFKSSQVPCVEPEHSNPFDLPRGQLGEGMTQKPPTQLLY